MTKNKLIELLIIIKFNHLLSKHFEPGFAVSLFGKGRQINILLLNLLHLIPGKESACFTYL